MISLDGDAFMFVVIEKKNYNPRRDRKKPALAKSLTRSELVEARGIEADTSQRSAGT